MTENENRLTKRLQEGKALCIAECEKECTEGYYECHKCKPFADVLVKLAEYEDIGTVEEFKDLKENQFFNFDSPVARIDKKSYDKAIDDFAKRICGFGIYDHWGNTIDILAIAEDLKGEKTMSEITIITTIEITDIQKNVPEDSELNKEEWKKGTVELLKSALQCDDVVVTNVQEFVLDENN